MEKEKPKTQNPIQIKKYGYAPPGQAPVFTARCTLPGDGRIIEIWFYRWMDKGELIYAFDGYRIKEIVIAATLTQFSQIEILITFLNVHKSGFMIGGKEANDIV